METRRPPALARSVIVRLLRDELHQFGSGRHATRLPFREDDAAVDQHVELAEGSPFDAGGDVQFALDVRLEAPGLDADVASHRAALDLDVHASSLPIASVAEQNFGQRCPE
jgi:hypothetical protein